MIQSFSAATLEARLYCDSSSPAYVEAERGRFQFISQFRSGDRLSEQINRRIEKSASISAFSVVPNRFVVFQHASEPLDMPSSLSELIRDLWPVVMLTNMVRHSLTRICEVNWSLAN
ncbi:hypothetical protein [Bradyrhizobium sp. CCBAU 21360]|uniref:hypothetical protein n=1 Tax=Bradyrhizobium sp. CCBAU 21360 TaxID=1325081 RepID=UPI002304D9CF|nr:hypothetical protein [Bradyrhizobium sp. CCBAU 21360]